MHPGITVVGVGSAAGPRDVCTLDIGAESRSRTADAALTAASECLRRVRTALLDGGVAATSLASGDMSLSPVYDSWPVVSGYAASLRLSAVLPDVSSAGVLVGAVVAAGGDDARVHAVSFGHSDPAALQAAARDAAFADAEDKATRLAGLAGRSLGEVIAIEDEAVGPMPGPRPMLAKGLAPMADVPVDAGEGSLGAVVRVRWALV